MKLAISIIITIAFFVVLITGGIKNIQFYQGCGGYLERASNANTIELAQKELSIAIAYIEANELTSGYTSVIWRTPDEDIGYWYRNIKTSFNELERLPDNASSLEKSNMLIKLRETLVDHGKSGSHITIPSGISRYPNNAVYGALIWMFLISGCIAWFIFAIDSEY